MLSGISWPQLLIVLVIVLAIFGTKKIRNLGTDLGSVVKGFRSSMSEAEAAKEQLNGVEFWSRPLVHQYSNKQFN